MQRIADPDWIKGPIIIAGNWEPLIYRRRCNALGTDGADSYEREHSPELVERLAEEGVNLLVTHYFKGFGLEGEREDIEYAHKLIRLCHEKGIKVGGYIGDTFIFETMLLEEPDARDWVQVREDGSLITYGSHTYRWKWCRNNPAFFKYMQRVLKLGIENGLDLIHFDNFLNKPEPFNCRCIHCENAFRSFLRNKYSAEQLKERFGFSNIGAIKPPVFSEPLYTAYGADIVRDPLFQEWIDFKCRALADSYSALSEYCRSLNPELAIECNPTGIWGENAANMRCVDHSRLLPHGHFFWDESPNPYGLQPNGALPTSIRSMKMGEALGNRIFHYCFHGSEETSQIRMGESLAYNGGCLGMVSFLQGDTIPAAAQCKPFVDFLYKHPELFVNTRSIAQVGVYRNFASLAYNAWEPHLQAILAEQILLQNHIPFDLLFELNELPPVVLVPGMECLSAEELAILSNHAETRGTVIFIGKAGYFDEWRRKRPSAPAEKLNDQFKLLPELELPDSAPKKDDRQVWDDFYKVVDGRFWVLPKNAEVLIDALEDAGINRLSVDAPPTTFIEPRMLAEDDKLIIHVVNYDTSKLGGKISINISGQKINEADVLSPLKDGINCQLLSNSAGATISIDNDAIYSLIVTA